MTCEGSNQQGRYVRDSTAGMIYQCPMCQREFVHGPYWDMGGTSRYFLIPVHNPVTDALDDKLSRLDARL